MSLFKLFFSTSIPLKPQVVKSLFEPKIFVVINIKIARQGLNTPSYTLPKGCYNHTILQFFKDLFLSFSELELK